MDNSEPLPDEIVAQKANEAARAAQMIDRGVGYEPLPTATGSNHWPFSDCRIRMNCLRLASGAGARHPDDVLKAAKEYAAFVLGEDTTPEELEPPTPITDQSKLRALIGGTAAAQYLTNAHTSDCAVEPAFPAGPCDCTDVPTEVAA